MLIRYNRIIALIAFSFVLTLILCACNKNKKTDPDSSSSQNMPLISTTANITTESYSKNTDEAESIDAYIILSNEKTTIKGYGAEFENNILSITDGGTFHLTGFLSDGKILVNSSNETKKVKLILDGVNISCSTDAPLFIENSPDETVLILQNGTTNCFSDTARQLPSDQTTDYATAAIYSKDDLQIEGSGELEVSGNFNKGIFSKNDIDIRGGIISINAADDGIRGKDSIEIESGTININCGGDGIRTSETEQEDKGDIEINGGIITITSDLDGIQATGKLTVNSGSVTVTTANGSTGNYSYIEQGFAGPGRNKNAPFGFSSASDSSIYEEISSDRSPSTKGIKSDKALTVNGGTLTLNCLDDSIHAPEITINGGELKLSSDDDGIHGDEKVTVNGGIVVITQSYEGVESKEININAGELTVTASDDGFNAASSATTENETAQNNPMNFGGPMGGMWDYDSSCMINMTDGFVLINAQGDGIDSNGNVNMTGGKMVVFGPTMGGNGALDYGGTFSVTGGTLLATGSLGMAQSVTGNGVEVTNFNVNGYADTLYALTDSNLNCKIAFSSPKQFQNVVFASDSLSADVLNLYSDGTVQNYSGKGGVYFDGIYTPGTLLGQITS